MRVFKPARAARWLILPFICIPLFLMLGRGVVNAEPVPVFVFAGPSNAIARRASYHELVGSLASWTAAQQNVLYAGPQGEAVGGTPTWQAIQPTRTATISFGPELSAGKVIAKALHTDIGIVKYAKGSSYLAANANKDLTWDPAVTEGLYSQLLGRVKLSLAQLPVQRGGATGKVAAFFWMGGENDAVNMADAIAYEVNLTNFIAQVRSDFSNPTLPFIFGLINVSNEPAPLPANSRIIRQAQVKVAATVPNAYLVDTDRFGRVADDFVHFNTQGVIDLGIAFGNTYLATIAEPTTTCCGIDGHSNPSTAALDDRTANQ